MPVTRAALLAGLLLALPAQAQQVPNPMSRDAGNAALPEASRNLGLPYTVKPGGNIQAGLDQAAANGGGAVYVQKATHNITKPLLIASNTSLTCEPGATIHALGASWNPPPSARDQKTAIQNVNWEFASTITDSNIEITGCNFTADATFTPLGEYHVIRMFFARDIRVARNIFTGGANGTAMIATDKTYVADNSMTGAINVCWDHWSAPTNLSVVNNYCETPQYGIMVTGTPGEGPGIAKYGAISGNTIRVTGNPGGGHAGMWLNGLRAGAGVQNITIIGNNISGDVPNMSCITLTGALTKAVVIADNTCAAVGSGLNAVGIWVGADEGGGAPSGVLVSNNIITDFSVIAGRWEAVIQVEAPDVTVSGNKIIGGVFPYCISLKGADDKAIGNECSAAGTSRYNTAGATNPTIVDYADAGVWTPNLFFGPGLAVGMAYTSRNGWYWRENKMVCAYFKFVLSAKGSSVGAATIGGWPAVLPGAMNGIVPVPVSLLWAMPGVTRAVYSSMDDVGLRLYDNGGIIGAQLTDANFSDTSQVAGGGCYPAVLP